MTEAIPQRIITITIQGAGDTAQVFYTYTSPVTNRSYVMDPTCDLLVDRAVYCLFVLDYSSTLAGWAIVDTMPKGNSPVLPEVAGPCSLSVMTINPHTTDDTYSFFINYFNQLTGQRLSVDPQEGNIPRPR